MDRQFEQNKPAAILNPQLAELAVVKSKKVFVRRLGVVEGKKLDATCPS